MGLLESGLNAGGNILSAIVNNAWAQKREQNAREENYRYNEQAANNADARTRALYNDLYSPAAQMQQLKEAGLSPSIYASGGLAGKSGSTGAQGAGASGIGPNVYGISALEMAQIANINADTKKKNAETGNIEEDTTLKQLQQDSLTLDNYIKDSQKDLFSKEMKAQIQQVNAATQKLISEAKGQDLANKWTKETWELNKKKLEEEINNITADTALKAANELLAKSNKELNDEQKKKIIAEVNQINNMIFIEAQKLEIYRKSVDEQAKFWEAQAKYFSDQITVAYAKIDSDIKIANQATQTAFYQMNNALYQGNMFIRMFGIANGNERFDTDYNPSVPII